MGNTALNHQRILAGLYLLMGIVVAIEVTLTYKETSYAISQFFSGSPVGYMYVLMAITILAPISCFVLAYLLNANSRNLRMSTNTSEYNAALND